MRPSFVSSATLPLLNSDPKLRGCQYADSSGVEGKGPIRRLCVVCGPASVKLGGGGGGGGGGRREGVFHIYVLFAPRLPQFPPPPSIPESRTKRQPAPPPPRVRRVERIPLDLHE